MNTATKTMIIDGFVAILREKGYKERDEEALNEARWYEKEKRMDPMGLLKGRMMIF